MVIKPTVRFWVDWDDDDIWDETNEDITSDVLRYRFEQSLSLRTGYSDPSKLVVRLKNAGHKYSKANESSVLDPNVVSGRHIWFHLGYPYDDFTGVDATDISARVFANDSSYSWEKINTSSRGFEINSNKVRPVVGSGDPAIYTVDMGDADAYIGLRFNRNTNAGGGLALRVTDKDNHIRIRFADSSTVLEDVTGGTSSSIRSGDALDSGDDYWVEVEMHGSSIRMWVTNLVDGVHDRKEILDGVGTAGYTTITKHGLWHQSSAQLDLFDDYGGWRSVFRGRIEDIVSDVVAREAEIIAFDDLHWMARKRLYQFFHANNVRVDSIIDNILTWSGFSLTHRELDDGTVIVDREPKTVWMLAGNALHSAQDEEDGLVYQDGAGYIRLEESGHRSSGSHTVSRVTINDDKANAPYFSSLLWRGAAEFIENDVTFRYNNPPSQGLQIAWVLREIPSIPAGENRDFLARSLVYRVVISMITPVINTDYMGNTQADGGGTDRTGSLTVTLVTTDHNGKGTLVNVANVHATDTVFITHLQLRANTCHEAFEDTTYQTEDATSQADHEPRSAEVECIFIDNYADATTIADRRLARLKDEKVIVDVGIDGHADRLNLIQLVHRVLSDRVTLSYADMGVSDAFFIDGVTLTGDFKDAGGETVGQWRLREV